MQRFLLIFMLLFGGLVFSQTPDNPWRIFLGINSVDIYPAGGDPDDFFAPQGELFESFFNIGDHWNFGIPSISLSRNIKGGLSIGLQGSLNKIKNIHGEVDSNYSYYSAGGYLKNSFLMDKKISPFVNLGFGYTSFDLSQSDKINLFSKNLHRTYSLGFGFDFNLSEKTGITINSTYKNPYENYGIKHFSHHFGLFYSFGTPDSDKDGVPDDKDSCPEDPGLKEFNGCPDTDGDGVPDNKDSCPEEFGLVQMDGCPDADSDGLADKDDKCPQVFGLIEMNGCPDSDSDGISDKDDECPKTLGDPLNNGCPWPDSDGDGIPDKDDLCPEEKGNPINNGCPELSNEIIQTLNELGTKINFMAESDKIIGRKAMNALKQIKELLDNNPNGVLIIEGYASSEGDEAYNQKLSERRAISVMNHLIGLGANPDRLETNAYGEDNPIGDNETIFGRSKNRRVQFKTKF